MDRGMLEINPDLIKLDYCIAISPELQQEMVEGISKLIGEPVEILSPKPGVYPDGQTHRIYIQTVAKKAWKSNVVDFSLQQLPGCCGILVSYNVMVNHPYQGKGINSFLQNIREKIAKENNYTLLMATTISSNLAEIHILEKYGWSRTNEFKNSRTGNTVLTYVKEIK